MAAGELRASLASRGKFVIKCMWLRNPSIQVNKGGFPSLSLRWLRSSWEYPNIDSVIISAYKYGKLWKS